MTQDQLDAAHDAERNAWLLLDQRRAAMDMAIKSYTRAAVAYHEAFMALEAARGDT
jgi:hypothetical protein